VNRKHEILRFLSKIIEMQKNIEMQSILSICTPTIDVEPIIEMQKNIEMQSILSICTPTIDVEPTI